MVCLHPEEAGTRMCTNGSHSHLRLPFSPRGSHGIYTGSSAALNGALG